MDFNTWLDTFLEEKEIDLERTFEVEGPEWGTNYMTIGVVVENIKIASQNEQKQIKDKLVQIDFYNGDVYDFLKFLGKALAR